MVDKYTGRSRGFAFVTYEQAEDCRAAIEAMNGKEIDGRAITVNNARQRTYAEEPGAEAPGGGDTRPMHEMGAGGGEEADGNME
jgi:RNA recognition motif-containing protein